MHVSKKRMMAIDLMWQQRGIVPIKFVTAAFKGQQFIERLSSTWPTGGSECCSWPGSDVSAGRGGNSLYFEIWGCLNYVLGVCWGSLGGLISSWIVWVKNVVYPPVLSWNSLFYGGCEEEFPFPLAGYVSCLDGYYSWMVNKIIEVGKDAFFFVGKESSWKDECCGRPKIRLEIL